MLQVIVSPAKQMRAAQDAFEVQGIPPFARETAQLHHALLDIERTEGDSSLQALWNVSNKLLGPVSTFCMSSSPSWETAILPIPVSRAASPLPSCPITAFSTRAWHPR